MYQISLSCENDLKHSKMQPENEICRALATMHFMLRVMRNADLLIVQKAIDLSETSDIAVIGDDTGLLILLLSRYLFLSITEKVLLQRSP